MINALKNFIKDKKSKRTVAVFSTLLVFVSLGIVSLLIDLKKTELASINNTSDSFDIGHLADDDLDGDGISDWEEVLLGFNPILRDTNSDGIDDGKLLLTLREISQLENPTENFENFEDLSKTDQILRKAYTTATVLESTGNLNEDRQQELSDTITKEMLAIDEYKLYREEQIKIALSNSVSSRYNYFLVTVQAVSKIDINNNNPAMFLLASIEQDNPKIIEDGLDPVISSLKTVRNELLSSRVPAEFVNYHLTLINTIQRTIQDTEQIQNFYQDPLLAYGAMVKLGSSMHDMNQAIANMTNYIEKQGQLEGVI